MGLFGKKNNKGKVVVDLTNVNNQSSALTSYDQLQFKVLNDVSDATLYEIGDIIKSNRPVEVDFSRVLDQPEAAQKFITFLSGVTFALDGKNVAINSSIIFGSLEAFKDGSIDEYVAKKKE